MTGTDLYIQRLIESNPLREPLLREIIRSLNFQAGSRGLDAGCGVGLQTLLLSDAVGYEGHVTGLDILPELLAHGSEMIAKAGLSDRILFREGDVSHLPFDEDSFDWVWSADCIGYPAGDLAPLLTELIRVVRHGGNIILLGWSSQQFLPGYPLLEARLNGTCSGYLPYLQDKTPEAHFMRAPYWFQRKGLKNIITQTFVCDICSPLDEKMRTALTSLFDMLWGTPQPDVSQHDWMLFEQLCKPDSTDFILNIPCYQGFFTYTVIRAEVDKRSASRITQT